jgi:hypothetical protein
VTCGKLKQYPSWSAHGFFGVATTAIPEPSFSVWIASTDKSSNCSTSGGYPFLFFSIMMGLQFFVVLFVYPETKGVSLEQMQKKLGIA